MSLDEIIKEELCGSIAKSYVAQITRFHRVTGSTMFHEAAEYVKSELLKMGLEDAAIEQFQADGAKKYWTYTSPLGWTVKSAELRLLEPEEKLLASYEDTPQSLHTYSNASLQRASRPSLLMSALEPSQPTMKRKTSGANSSSPPAGPDLFTNKPFTSKELQV